MKIRRSIDSSVDLLFSAFIPPLGATALDDVAAGILAVLSLGGGVVQVRLFDLQGRTVSTGSGNVR